MKKNGHLSFRNKRTILAASVLGVTALTIGGVIAVSQDRSVFNNGFHLFGYHTIFTETFDAPNDWTTCQTIPKTITVKNESDEPVAVRIKLEEQWLASDGVTELPLVSANSGLAMAQINFAPNSGWTKQGSYYYYDTDLAKNQTAATPITGVTLNCDANLDASDTADDTADGDYSDATYHLKVTAQTIDADSAQEWNETLYNTIVSQPNNGTDENINFRLGAVLNSTNPNGAGINIRANTKNDDYPIYYYRGDIANNNVIWGGYCWKIVRTTDTGGTKMIYSGLPTVVGNQPSCPDMGAGIVYNNRNTFPFNSFVTIASFGYMVGDSTIVRRQGSVGESNVSLAKTVTRNGSTYALNDIITGSWNTVYKRADTDHKYVCLEGSSSSCSKLAFITQAESGASYTLYYDITGYDDINDYYSSRVVPNDSDSSAKEAIDAWFEENLLDYESDLEDTVFCNDRYISNFQEDESQFDSVDIFLRNHVEKNEFSPTLDCKKKVDSFSKIETAKSNGKLKHSIALINVDELTFAGSLNGDYGPYRNVFTKGMTYTMSPADYYSGYVSMLWSYGTYSERYPSNPESLRPVVSLKNSVRVGNKGTGELGNPYIVE